jgi:hypothetical protein
MEQHQNGLLSKPLSSLMEKQRWLGSVDEVRRS